MVTILTTNSGACYGLSIPPDSSKTLYCSLFNYNKNLKPMHNSPKHCVQDIRMGVRYKGHTKIVEERWQEFFSDPSQWWDHRSGKDNKNYPDFKHKKKPYSLWLDGKLNPPWVEEQLAAMPVGTLQLDLFTWNKKLAGLVKAGNYEKTLEVFRKVQQEGRNPNKYTFIPVVNACSHLRDLKEGRHIHTQITLSGCESDLHVGSCLVDMYAKCGSIVEAWRVFQKMPTHDVVAWSAIILGYVKCGQPSKALELSQQMNQEGLEPDCSTFLALLNACTSLGALEDGRCVHELIIQGDLGSNEMLASYLVHMYAKCGSMEDAWNVFNKMPMRNVAACTAMILGLVKYGQGNEALKLSQQMQQEGVKPDPALFVAMLNACGSVAALEEGRHVHEQISQSGCRLDGLVGSCLIDMYAKCGSIDDASRVFKQMPVRDMDVWNAMIQGYVKCGQGHNALETFRLMEQEGVKLNRVTFLGVLNACASVSLLQEGRRVHKQINNSQWKCDLFVCSCLIDMYAKCGSIEDASRVFNTMSTRNVVTWNALILGCVKCGQAQKALELCQQMKDSGVDPTGVTFVGMLNACASLSSLEEGRHVHKEIIEHGHESDVFVGNSLIDMYGKCGSIEDAESVFKKMPSQNPTSWTAMLGAYVRHGLDNEAVGHFKQMCQGGVKLNEAVFNYFLSACSNLGLVDEGLHHFKLMRAKYNISPTERHYICMISLLGRVGHLNDAEDLIETNCELSISLWMCLLGFCRDHGDVERQARIAKRVTELDLQGDVERQACITKRVTELDLQGDADYGASRGSPQINTRRLSLNTFKKVGN